MKTQITAIAATLLAAGALNAFGQGYIIFGASRDTIYDYPDVGGVSSSETTATFLWSTTGANDLLGAGIPTTGIFGGIGWPNIVTMIASGGWDVAYNGSSEADAVTIGSGVEIGGINYDGSADFLLGGQGSASSYSPGATLYFIMVAWYNQGDTINTIEEAEAENADLGWDSEFTYATGASSTAPVVSTFNASGASDFGLQLVPEPTTLALAGLGGLSMLLFRRRRGHETLTKSDHRGRPNRGNSQRLLTSSPTEKGIVGDEVTRL